MPAIEERPRRIGGGFAGGQPRAVADDSVAFRDSVPTERSQALSKMDSPMRSGFIPAVMRDVMVSSSEERSEDDLDPEAKQEGLRQKNEREYLRRVFIRIWSGGDKAKQKMKKTKVAVAVGLDKKQMQRAVSSWDYDAADGNNVDGRAAALDDAALPQAWQTWRRAKSKVNQQAKAAAGPASPGAGRKAKKAAAAKSPTRHIKLLPGPHARNSTQGVQQRS